jgi:hypothetical protein
LVLFIIVGGCRRTDEQEIAICSLPPPPPEPMFVTETDSATGVEGRGWYVYNDKEGLWAYWYADQRPKATGSYRRGKLDGFWTGWHPNGQVAETGAYKDGLRDGPWLLMEPSGSIDAENSGLYDAGQKTRALTADEVAWFGTLR